MSIKHPSPTYYDLLKQATSGLPVRPWTPLKPKPLAGYVQERIDSYRAIRSLIP